MGNIVAKKVEKYLSHYFCEKSLSETGKTVVKKVEN